MSEPGDRVLAWAGGVAIGVSMVACGAFMIGLGVENAHPQTVDYLRVLHSVRGTGITVVAGGGIVVISMCRGLWQSAHTHLPPTPPADHPL
ncbi:MAG: hypothetical protein NVS4B3_01520 [Gemmatimonadaceae bacterium]